MFKTDLVPCLNGHLIENLFKRISANSNVTLISTLILTRTLQHHFRARVQIRLKTGSCLSANSYSIVSKRAHEAVMQSWSRRFCRESDSAGVEKICWRSPKSRVEKMLDSDSLFFQNLYAINYYLNLNRIADYSGRGLVVSLQLYLVCSNSVSIQFTKISEMAPGQQSQTWESNSRSRRFTSRPRIRVVWILLRLCITGV